MRIHVTYPGKNKNSNPGAHKAEWKTAEYAYEYNEITHIKNTSYVSSTSMMDMKGQSAWLTAESGSAP